MYENSVVMDYSKNSVAAHSGSHFMSFNWFSAPDEIIFFANLEDKTLLVLPVFSCLAQKWCVVIVQTGAPGGIYA